MTYPTVAVTVVLGELGGPTLPGIDISVRLSQDDRYKGFVLSEITRRGVTDAAGSVVFNLFPNNPTTGLGTTGSVYIFEATVMGKPWRVLAQIPNAPCNLHDVAAVPTSLGSSSGAGLPIGSFQFNAGNGALAGAAGLSWDSTNSAITALKVGFGAPLIASAPLLNAQQTWNNAAVAFTADRLNIVDTASAAGSLLMDRQVNGVSVFSVRKDGGLSFNRALINGATDDGVTALQVNGTIRAGSSNVNGYTMLVSGDAGHSGRAEFFSAAAVRQGYIGYSTTTGATDTGTLRYIAGVHAFTGSLSVAGTVVTNVGVSGIYAGTNTGVPYLVVVNSGGAVNERVWDNSSSGTALLFRALNDAGTVAGTWAAINRSGTTITSIALAGRNLINGATDDGVTALQVNGTIRAGSSNVNGYTTLVPGDASHSGRAEFFSAAAVRQGYIGYSTTTGTTDTGTLSYIAGVHAFLAGRNLINGATDDGVTALQVNGAAKISVTAASAYATHSVNNLAATGYSQLVLNANLASAASFLALQHAPGLFSKISNNSTDAIQIAPNGSVVASFTTTGLAVTGVLTATSTVSATGAILTAVAPTAAAAQIAIGSTTATTVGAADAGAALPATPTGYWIINVAGTAQKVPYYN